MFSSLVFILLQSVLGQCEDLRIILNALGQPISSPCCETQGISCRNNFITKIEIQSDKIVGDIVSEISRLKNLEVLKLVGGQLGPLPDQLYSLKNLIELDLSRNNIVGSLSPAIKNLKRLQKLMLNDNKLERGIPSEIGSLSNLNTLILSNNQFDGKLPDTITTLTKLKTMRIDNNLGITGPIPQAITKLEQLADLDLRNTSISGEVPVGWFNQQLTEKSGCPFPKTICVFPNQVISNCPVTSFDSCPGEPTKFSSQESREIYTIVVLGIFVVFLIILIYILFRKRNAKLLNRTVDDKDRLAKIKDFFKKSSAPTNGYNKKARVSHLLPVPIGIPKSVTFSPTITVTFVDDESTSLDSELIEESLKDENNLKRIKHLSTDSELELPILFTDGEYMETVEDENLVKLYRAYDLDKLDRIFELDTRDIELGTDTSETEQNNGKHNSMPSKSLRISIPLPRKSNSIIFPNRTFSLYNSSRKSS